MESWRAVEGYDGDYEVSDQGRVRSRKSGQWRLRSTKPNVYGYPALVLYRDNHWTSYTVHILVARTFIGPCPEGMEVAHFDGNPLNNAVSNLRYATRQGNADDRARHGTHRRGERVPTHKLTAEAVREIRRSWAVRDSTRRALAERYGVSESAIQQVTLGKNWASVA